MKKFISIIWVAVITLSIQSCSDKTPTSNEDQNNNDEIYFNSFEADNDTSGWVGLSKNMFANDPCPENGTRSMHIGGGCPQPAAAYQLSSLSDGKYKLSFWGKMGQDSQTAQIILKASDGSDEDEKIIVVVDGTGWKSYKSERELYVSTNKKLSLEIWVGGFVAGDVYIDNLKIEKVYSSFRAASIYKNVIGIFK